MNCEWSTPDELFQSLSAEFGPFTLDACATPDNAKCAKFFTKEQDGLAQDWRGETVWMNPPYDRVADWMRKAWKESMSGSRVVCLVRASTGSRWWHDYAMKARKIRFLKGRLSFRSGDRKGRANFDSAIVVFGS